MKSEYLSFLENCKNILGETEGVRFEEIECIESLFNIKLPFAYIEYLLQFGRKSGNLLGSYLTEINNLDKNKESAKVASVDELDGVQVPIEDSYFFFGQWQGYIFYFFDCEEDCENPPVYILTDSPKIEKYKDSFSEFIRDEGLKPLLGL